LRIPGLVKISYLKAQIWEFYSQKYTYSDRGKVPFKINKMGTFIVQGIRAVSALFVVWPFSSLPTAQKPFMRNYAFGPVALQVTA